MHYKVTAGSCELRIHAQRQFFFPGAAQKGDARGVVLMRCELPSAWTASCAASAASGSLHVCSCYLSMTSGVQNPPQNVL